MIYCLYLERWLFVPNEYVVHEQKVLTWQSAFKSARFRLNTSIFDRNTTQKKTTTRHQFKHDYSISSSTCEYDIHIIEFECMQLAVSFTIPGAKQKNTISNHQAIYSAGEQTIVGKTTQRPRQQSTLNAYWISCECSIHSKASSI